MNGEIGIKIKKIVIGRPYVNCVEGVVNDITFVDETGDFLHLCGDNNIAKLLNDALNDYKNKAVCPYA